MFVNPHLPPPSPPNLVGPFSINGVPLRRVSQAYVIATQTKVDVGGLVIPDRLTDDYFRRARSEKKQGEGSLFTDSKQVLPLRGLEASHIRYTLVYQARPYLPPSRVVRGLADVISIHSSQLV